MFASKRELLLGGGALVIGLAGGFAAGFFLDKKKTEDRLAQEYNEIANEEIERTRVHYAMFYKRAEFSDVPTTEAVEAVVEAVTDYSSPAVETESNIFVNGEALKPEDFDMEAEVEKRDPGYPYVITLEEFMDNPEGFEQTQVTWYEEDSVLADVRDNPMDDVDSTVGAFNLERFGHGSGDPNIVLVRNERLDLDFEIARSTGSYAEEVAGLKHSDEIGIRRFRREYE